MGGVLLDGLAQLEVEVECLLDAGVQHTEPVRGGLFELGHAEQVAGLDDDFKRVGEVVGEAAQFQGQFFRNGGGGVGHSGDSVARNGQGW